jgi:hypothetical protein
MGPFAGEFINRTGIEISLLRDKNEYSYFGEFYLTYFDDRKFLSRRKQIKNFNIISEKGNFVINEKYLSAPLKKSARENKLTKITVCYRKKNNIVHYIEMDKLNQVTIRSVLLNFAASGILAIGCVYLIMRMPKLSNHKH